MFEASLGYMEAHLKRKKKLTGPCTVWKRLKIGVGNKNELRRDSQLSAAALCWDKREMHFISTSSTAGNCTGPGACWASTDNESAKGESIPKAILRRNMASAVLGGAMQCYRINQLLRNGIRNTLSLIVEQPPGAVSWFHKSHHVLDQILSPTTIPKKLLNPNTFPLGQLCLHRVKQNKRDKRNQHG